MSPNIVKARYTGPSSRGQSAARLARYISERRAEDGRREKATTFGDRGAFVAAAKERSEAGRRSSYTHLVVSPQNGSEFTDRDFEKLCKPLIYDRQGNRCAYIAAIHRDSEHHHLHLAVARDKYQRQELASLKSQTEERIRGRERFHEFGDHREQGLEGGSRDKAHGRDGDQREPQGAPAGNRDGTERGQRGSDHASRQTPQESERATNAPGRAPFARSDGSSGRDGSPESDARTNGLPGERRRAFEQVTGSVRDAAADAGRAVNRELGRTPDVERERVPLSAYLFGSPGNINALRQQFAREAREEQELVDRMRSQSSRLEREYHHQTERRREAQEQGAQERLEENRRVGQEKEEARRMGRSPEPAQRKPEPRVPRGGQSRDGPGV